MTVIILIRFLKSFHRKESWRDLKRRVTSGSGYIYVTHSLTKQGGGGGEINEDLRASKGNRPLKIAPSRA